MTDNPKVSTDRVLNVEALAETLGQMEQFAKLPHAIQHAKNTQSCLAELAVAAECICVLKNSLEIGGSVDIKIRKISEMALLYTAIMHYVRATADDSRGRGRGASKIASKLSPEVQKAHNRLVNLRHNALAHINDLQAPSEYRWHESLMIGRNVGGAWNLGAVRRQTTISLSALEDLQRCLDEAEPILKMRVDERIAVVTTMISSVPMEILDAHTVTPHELFETVSIADQILLTDQ